MPDVYMINPNEMDPIDFVTAMVIQLGYPFYYGRILGLLASLPTMMEALAYINQNMGDSIIKLMDSVHPSFGPTDAFMEALEYTEVNLFPMDSSSIYVQMNRFDATARFVLFVIIGLLVKAGLGSQLITFGAGWVAKMVTSKKFTDLSDEIEMVGKKVEMMDVVSNIGGSEDSLRLANLEKYIHVLGEAIRTNNRDFNGELSLRGSANVLREDSEIAPKWPLV